MAKTKQNNLSKLIYFIITFFTLVVIDSYFSDLITDSLHSGFNFRTDILTLSYVENTGAAFNLLEGNLILLITLSVIALVFLIYYVISHLKNLSMLMILGISFLLAGIFCNLFERAAFGYVRDFFELSFINFPIFNISDVFINIGVIMVIWLMIKKNIL